MMLKRTEIEMHLRYMQGIHICPNPMFRPLAPEVEASRENAQLKLTLSKEELRSETVTEENLGKGRP
jgi:hypothetical protein